MKLIKNGMRIWITLASLGSFFIGWFFLAHSPKPAPLSQPPAVVEPLPTLEPLRPFNRENGSFQSFPTFPQTRSAFPRLRTGGS